MDILISTFFLLLDSFISLTVVYLINWQLSLANKQCDCNTLLLKAACMQLVQWTIVQVRGVDWQIPNNSWFFWLWAVSAQRHTGQGNWAPMPSLVQGPSLCQCKPITVIQATDQSLVELSSLSYQLLWLFQCTCRQLSFRWDCLL